VRDHPLASAGQFPADERIEMCIRSLFICRSALSLWNIGDALVGASLSSWVVRSTCRKWIKSSQQHKNRTHNWGYPKKALNGLSIKESKIILCALLSSDKSNLQGLRPVGHVTAMARLRKGGTLGTAQLDRLLEKFFFYDL
jgi:hypothetical protein